MGADADQDLSGWGRFPVERCRLWCAPSVQAAREVIADRRTSTWIPRGLGRAYGDSALNRGAGVALMTSLDRFLSFDEVAGVLECEAGVSLATIIETFLPRGWFLPTTPGTKMVTVGGAIAADVHGKNHHVDGSFGAFVDHLDVLVASGEILRCSRTEHPDLFAATLGGMGLTGVILSARLRLTRVESAYYDVTYRRTKDLDETLDQLAATEREYRYSVAWIDALAKGRNLGRAVLMLGHDARVSDLPAHLKSRPLTIHHKGQVGVPFDFPSFALNKWSVRAFNTTYYAAQRDRRELVDYDSFFYPLDRVGNWNRVYGARGFVQYQALFPKDSARLGCAELLERIAQSGKASFLSVLKTSGAAGIGHLSYLFPGVTLALDMANTGEDIQRLSQDLDAILLRYGGRLYLAKDALTSRQTFEAMYPTLGAFREIKGRFDPNQIFRSSQAARLGLVEQQ